MPDYTGQLNQIINALNQFSPIASQQTLNLISAVAAALAAFGGLWAAHAASKSARTAEQAADNVQKIARLGILRDAIAAAYDVMAEHERVKSLVDEVKLQIKTLAIHAGHGPNSSVVKEITEKAESQQSQLTDLQQAAQDLVHKRSTLADASEAELMHELSKFDGYLTKTRRIRYEL